jgi:cysteine-rich repeat protein
MVLKKAWIALTALLLLGVLPACAKNNASTSTTGGVDGGDVGGAGGAGGDSGGSGGHSGGSGGMAAACGDGKLATTESCDDGNTKDGDGCSAKCEFETGWDCMGTPTACTPKCGDGLLVGKEACDDKNTTKGDGCNDVCVVENGYVCTGAPSVCKTVCGDMIIAGKEQCDDGNTTSMDGCDDMCAVEAGWACVGQPSKCATTCGDGIVSGMEQCDDGSTLPGDGCDAMCQVEPFFTCMGMPSMCVTPCGDGNVAGTEQCDDGNKVNGDGCDQSCKPESGYVCMGMPSVCSTVCGDGVKAGAELCDDGNMASNDGCNAVCKIEPGWKCMGSPSMCVTTCGDGYPAGPETCDDGNLVNGDGCDSTCLAEHGYVCNNIPSVCQTVCGDGVKGGTEQCDDGNMASGDGCSSNCNIQQGFNCMGEPSVCTSICGDGIVAGTETCDDGNLVNGDCCSSTCGAEAGCEIEPNDAIPTANVFTNVAMGNNVKGVVKPGADLDVFDVVIPAGKTGVIVASTLDGFNSTCATNSEDSFITVYDANGNPLASDNDSGPGLCSVATAVNLMPGDYFIEVKSGNSGNPTVFSYTLNVQISFTVCGNGTKEPGEQCDDGNVVNGDGCDSTCKIETANEIEPNNTSAQATANGPFPTNKLWAGAITPAGDVDYYEITLVKAADLKIQTFDQNGPGNCASIDTILDLWASNGTTNLAHNDDGGIPNCSLIDSNAAGFAGAKHLLPGNYFVSVKAFSAGSVIGGYKVQITFNALCGNNIVEGSEQCDGNGGPPCDPNCMRIPVCGDGFVDLPETCDDSNTVNGDGCSSTCQIEGAQNEVEPDNTIAQANASPVQVSGDALITGSIGVIGDKDYYKVTVATPGVIRFETFEVLYDCTNVSTTLRLYDSSNVQIKTDSPDTVESGINNCAALVNPFFSAGTYYIEVEQIANNATTPYLLQVKYLTNLGNEVEPNDLQSQATSTSGADFAIYGDHSVSADLDYYAITVPAGKSIRAEVVEGDTLKTCESDGIDTYITLFDTNANTLVTDDDSGRGWCSAFDGTGNAPHNAGAHNLAAGTYYIQVKAFGVGAASIFNYKLAVTVR